MAHRKPLTFDITDKGCKVCTSHTPNKDGYIRLFVSDKASPRMQFLHRIVWEEKHGRIPDGYEINHKCHNRACSNLDHLECITGENHTALTNKERASERAEAAKDYWTRNRCTGKVLSDIFGFTHSMACHYIRRWKLNV